MLAIPKGRLVKQEVKQENLEKAIEALEQFVDGFPTKQEAADSLGVSKVYLWRMLTGKRPLSESVLNRIGWAVKTTKTMTYYIKEK